MDESKLVSVVDDNILFLGEHLNQAYMRGSFCVWDYKEITNPPPRNMFFLVSIETGKIVGIGNATTIEEGILAILVSVEESGVVDSGLFPKQLLRPARDNLARTLQIWNQRSMGSVSAAYKE